ncbi:MAG: hypothetical protein II718_07860 [Clostridiales bacterium]|nr:hypothetical protein [Clostridiales bacterium]
MSVSKDEALKRAKQALDRAQEKYDKIYAEWRDEMDTILLKPAHARLMTRKQVIALARAIENEDSFKKIMEMGMIPVMSKENKNNDKENRNEIVKEN